MESNVAVVSEPPRAKKEAVKKDITTVVSGGAGDMKKPVVGRAVTVDLHGRVASITSSPAKTGSPQETKKMKNKNRVHISNTKKPFLFYLNLAKRYIKNNEEVELCGLGMAIPTVITLAEILKQNGIAIQKGVRTSTAISQELDRMGRQVMKARIEIVLAKAEILDTTNVAVTPNKAAHKKA
ncbi:DNA/RNA-binding protein Alba-like protein [Corchorus capsularis]|uniref:DNA/RNA-binding protein Alba-like protein n=1 Tax=Corchorus capsularis TaxID=210143 RepID=A0A1R3G9N6_COCAP|nr:DNA/RNA-binding protein Alba-like protein [Corchorus capsularis]